MTDRKKVIEILWDWHYRVPGGTDEYDALMDAIALLKEQESIIDSLKSDLSETLDVVTNRKNVVRCKDCKHGRLYAQDLVDCELQELAKEADWFCADGERKVGEVG